MQVKEGDYIIALKTIRGECKKGRRYEIHGIYEKGHESEMFDVLITYTEDAYFIIHNGKMTISDSSNFEYDYKYNRKLKINKILT